MWWRICNRHRRIRIIDYNIVLTAVKTLTRPDQFRLLQDIIGDLADLPADSGELDDETRRLLDARLADEAANPIDVVPWEQVYAEAKARLRK